MLMDGRQTDNSHTDAEVTGILLAESQTWGELIVNANALIMHSFFSSNSR